MSKTYREAVFEEGFTETAARAELVSLKQDRWPIALKLLFCHLRMTGRPWVDRPQSSGLKLSGHVFCFNHDPNHLMGLVFFPLGALVLPDPTKRVKWKPLSRPAVDRLDPLTKKFRDWVMDDRGLRSWLLSDHSPIRWRAEDRSIDVYEAVPRQDLVNQIKAPTKNLVTGARVGLKHGDYILWLPDPEFPKFEKTQTQGQFSAELSSLPWKLRMVHDHPLVRKLLPIGDDFARLRERAGNPVWQPTV